MNSFSTQNIETTKKFKQFERTELLFVLVILVLIRDCS